MAAKEGRQYQGGKKERPPLQAQVFFFGILAFMFLLTFRIFQPFLLWMVAGVLVAVLALPIDKFWEKVWWGRSKNQKKRARGNRISAFFTMISIFLFITVRLP